MLEQDVVRILAIIIGGGVVITPLGLLFILHRRAMALRRRHKQPRRR